MKPTILSDALALGYTQTNDHAFLTLCDIQMWLMKTHNIVICIMPLKSKYSYFIVTPSQFNQPFTIAGHNTWLGAFTAAIESALNYVKNGYPTNR